ncbi:unnamed protein product, partial [Ectocarpus sp. 8 AP-2014]
NRSTCCVILPRLISFNPEACPARIGSSTWTWFKVTPRGMKGKGDGKTIRAKPVAFMVHFSSFMEQLQSEPELFRILGGVTFVEAGSCFTSRCRERTVFFF